MPEETEQAAKRQKSSVDKNIALFTEVASSLAAYFEGLHQCNIERLKEVWHPQAHLYGVGPDGKSVVDRDAPTFFAGVAARGNSDKIDIASTRCAVAKVQIALPASPTSPTPSFTDVLYTDFLVLLRLGGEWKIISKVFSAVPLPQSSYHEPYDSLGFTCAEPVRGVLEYYRGGHLSQTEIMSENFHEVARLCYADVAEHLVCLSRSEFFDRVKNRPSTAGDSDALKYDKIMSVDKAGPDVALIKLQIGYPPMLYTDFLSMLKLGDDGGSLRRAATVSLLSS
eukprot:CAMPEP_0169262322 /NCGR_PEP_ID=MMETSP1016-20121227/43644_1 /TAXON_ID=342587 /ORGANISM="Karlodinium micrum, Strain CCMP2283" /LENGTH=281 /DNA_ID=CAMNT_0009344837 /DNA_START=9 /DNA_END=852 /DNA_ORIENTATION=-